MKELNVINKPEIPYDIRLRTAVKLRDYRDALTGIKEEGIDCYVEVYNSNSIFKEPNIVGITVFYPNRDNITHMVVREFDISISERDIERQVKLMKKEIKKKIS